MNKLIQLLGDKHTSFPGLLAAVAQLCKATLPGWFPAKADQIKSTCDAVTGFAIGYLGVAAASAKSVDCKVNEVKDAVVSGDTSHLKKSDAPDAK
jgi:hypothetical protein